MAISELQWALMGTGGVAIVAVWGYNIWQDRQHRKAAERLFKGEQTDVLLQKAPAGENEFDAPDTDAMLAANTSLTQAEQRDQRDQRGQRLEPTLGHGEDLPETEVTSAHNIEELPAVPTIDVAPDQPLPPISSEPEVASSHLVVIDNDVSPADPFADCVVRFSVPEPVPASSIWAAQSAWRSGIAKPLLWLGCNPGDAVWHEVNETTSGRYSEWVAALQIADRRGALSDSEINLFCAGLEQMAGRLGISIALPDRADTLQRAAALDAFCAGVDVEFGISVVEATGGSFAGTKLRGVCEAAGLTLGSDGCFHSLNDNGAEEFRITNIGSERFVADSIRSMATHGVTLTIDVPRVADGAAAFTRLINTAQQLARGLGGVVVDTQRVPLADAMAAGIRGKIVELQQQMKAAEIPPGSTRAFKLFS
jgi:FtsZ-interacting cell division protein ZipA